MTDKQKRFVEEYLIDSNATQAAIRAGYSQKTAYSSGQRMLKNVEVSEAIKKLQAATSQRLEITREKLLLDLEKDKMQARKLNQVSASIKASEVQARMLGLNEPEKVEVSGRVINVGYGDSD